MVGGTNTPSTGLARAGGVERFADGVFNFLTDISNRAALQLSPIPGRAVLLAPGEAVAWDNCCEGGGQVWARLQSMRPLPTNDPARRPGLHACAVPELLITAEVGVIRCAATVNDRGQAPSPDQIARDGRQSIDDVAGLLGVLRCTSGIRGLGEWVPQGPEGGCHGGYWTFNALVANCIYCIDPEEETEGEG